MLNVQIYRLVSGLLCVTVNVLSDSTANLLRDRSPASGTNILPRKYRFLKTVIILTRIELPLE